MRLFDLQKLIDDQYYTNTVQNKINETWVKYNGEYIYISAHFEDGEYDSNEDYHSGDLNISGVGYSYHNGCISMNDLPKFEVDFVWPDAGYYDYTNFEGEEHHVALWYSNMYSWKVGLPSKLLATCSSSNLSGIRVRSHMLSTIREPNRTIEDCIRLIQDEGISRVPMNSDIGFSRDGIDAVRAWTGSFTSSFPGQRLGSLNIETGEIILNSTGKHFTELLDHYQVAYHES